MNFSRLFLKIIKNSIIFKVCNEKSLQIVFENYNKIPDKKIDYLQLNFKQFQLFRIILIV